MKKTKDDQDDISSDNDIPSDNDISSNDDTLQVTMNYVMVNKLSYMQFIN